jgi:hypothetical protein
MRIVLALAAVLTFTGCAGKLDYFPPTSLATAGANSKLIERPRNAVWDKAIPELGKQYFVINNLDRSSGIINISYTGDPEFYIDCGRIVSYVKNAQGERTYDFAGAKAQQRYEIMNPSVGLFEVDRRMNLDGRVNIIFEELGPSSTRVTANTRYVVARTQTIRNVGNNFPQTTNDTLTFNSGGRASFPPARDGRSSECAATGALEDAILRAVE